MPHKLKYMQGVRRFCKGVDLYIAFAQSHRPEEAILDSYDKYEARLRSKYLSCLIFWEFAKPRYLNAVSSGKTSCVRVWFKNKRNISNKGGQF